MNMLLTAMKVTVALVMSSLLFVPLNSLAGSFVKTKELTNFFKHGILKISASEDGSFVFIKDGNRDYWLMESIRPFLFSKIFNDPERAIEDKPIGEQWSNQHIIFFYREKIEFYNVQNQKNEHHYPLKLPGLNLNVVWSEKHRRFIINTQIFSVDSNVEKNLSQERHAYQTGLVIMDNGDDYITSGYHDQRIMRWTLPDGELKKTWQLGSWYSSRKVSGLALIDNHLLVASSNGLIEERSLEDGSVLWSASPCRHFLSGTTPSFLFNGSKDKSINHNRLVFYDCHGLGAGYGFIEKQDNEWALNEINLPSAGDASLERMYYLDSSAKAILGLGDGQVLLYDLENKRVDQVIISKSPEGDGTAVFAYLKADKLLVVVERDSVDIYQYQ